MIDYVKHDLVVYYCTDDYAAHPGVDRAHIAECDATLTKRANLVFVVPQALLEAKRAVNPRTNLAPHGVDADLFGRAQAPDTKVPAAAAALPHPVIGYFGLIAAWTDVELISWLARERPSWHFLLVGYASVDVRCLAGLPNVTLAGAQPYATLPGWAKAFDVAIIPYRDTRQVRHANPLKLREYLATGKPVVSVATPEVEHFRDIVRIAHDRENFLTAIEDALHDRSDSMRQRRMQSVAGMTWDHRVDETLGIVMNALRRGPEGADRS